MSLETAEAHQTARRSFGMNIRRFYAFDFLGNFQPWIPIWVLYLIEFRGLSLAQVAILEAMFQVIIIVAEMPTGAIADRFGRKTSLLIGAALNPLAIIAFGLGDSFELIFVSYAIWALSFTLYSGANTALVYDSLASDGREGEFSRVMGKSRSIGFLAGMLASLIGAPLAAATDLSVPIFVGAAMTVGAGMVVLTFREPDRHDEEGERLPYLKVMSAALRFARDSAPTRTMIALHAVLAGGALSIFIMIQPYLSGHGVSTGQMGFFIVIAQLSAVAGGFTAHRIAGRLGEPYAFVTLTAGFVFGFAVLAAVDSIAGIAAFGLLYFANAAFMPLSYGYISRHAPQRIRATMVSICSMAASLSVAVSQPVIGIVADATSLQGAFALVAALLLVFGLLAMVAWLGAYRRGGEREQELVLAEAVAAGAE